MACNEKPDIVCITEAWKNEKKFGDTKMEYSLDNYKLLLWQRENNVGGGLAIYIKEHLNAVEVDNLKSRNSSIELIWFNIAHGQKNLRLCVCYRPPNQTEQLDNDRLAELTEGCNHNVTILGDFNLPNVN